MLKHQIPIKSQKQWEQPEVEWGQKVGGGEAAAYPTHLTLGRGLQGGDCFLLSLCLRVTNAAGRGRPELSGGW